MKELVSFDHPEFDQVRVHLDERGEPWFCALDIAQSMLKIHDLDLGPNYKCNPERAFACVPSRMKSMQPIATDNGLEIMLTLNENGFHYIFKEPCPALRLSKWKK